jgi:serine phosphatase RsbU (regulator of sigma subunit)
MKKKREKIMGHFLTAGNFTLVLILSFPFFGLSQSEEPKKINTPMKELLADTTRLSEISHRSELADGDATRYHSDTAIRFADAMLKKWPDIPAKIKRRILMLQAYAYNNIGFSYSSRYEYEKAIPYFNQAILLHRSIDDMRGVAICLNNIGDALSSSGQRDEAAKYFKIAAQMAEELKEMRLLSICYSLLADIARSGGDIPATMDYYEKSLKINEKRKDKDSKDDMAFTLNMIGYTYFIQKNDSDALIYYFKSLKLREELKDKKGMAQAYANISVTYFELDDMPKSLDYFDRSLKIKREINDSMGIAISYGQLASFYLKKKDHKTALDHFMRSLEIRRVLHAKIFLPHSYSKIAHVYFKIAEGEKNTHKRRSLLLTAKAFNDTSLTLARELKDASKIETGAQSMKEILFQLKNFKGAYEAQKLYYAMADSINNVRNKEASYKYKVKYEYEKKAVADSVRIADEKKLNEIRIAETDQNLAQEKTQRYALFGGLTLSLIFGGLLVNRFKESKKQTGIIRKQKSLVEGSRQKTIASINYAKKIQDSILPDSNEISSYFAQHFIFFRPKDIVSGDFYWFHREGAQSYIAVADCTGHGVPGAFMTMIAHAALIETVIEKKINDPGKILSSLHELVFKNLQQHKGGEYSQDGMDISFVRIDHQQNLISFAGARNHGHLIDGTEIRTMKAQARSIGGLSVLGEVEPQREFRSETFQLNAGTLIALSTDGIIDQLNENDEKFGNENFKKLLLQLNSVNDTDTSSVKNTIDQWKGNTPQLDDELLFCLRY